MKLFKEFVLRLSKQKNIPSSLINIFLLINLKKESIIQIFNDNIINEEFLMDNDKKILQDLYISVVKIINRFKTLVRIYKFKKAVKYDIDTDLHLDKLDILPDNQKILILENNTLYNFKLKDLLSCWKLALLNTQGLFSKPFEVKNPYTNIPIKKHNLYNIYFKCLNMYVNLPMCITIFFKCNMDLNKFQLNYFTTLKEVAIINFINSNNYYEMFEQVLNMLHDHRKLVNYLTFTNYCPPSSRVRIVNKFRPILMNYLLSKFSCNPIVKEQKLNSLKKQLLDLHKKDDDFGFERGFEVMRYVPISERPIRTQPPPPPPSLINELRNRRNTLRRTRNSRQTISFSDSDSDDISDLDIVENVPAPPQEMTPISVTIPPPPPPIVNTTPTTQIINFRRPSNPPPPPPPSSNIVFNPFIATRQIPRTPTRNTVNNNIQTRQNVVGFASRLRMNLNYNNNNFSNMNFNN